jgi:hypothetical protein
MGNPFENNKIKYTEKNYVEKPQYFMLEQEKFLDSEVAEMNEDALLEEDYKKIYSKDFIEESKNKVLQIENKHKIENKIKDKRSEVEENFFITTEYKKTSDYLEALFYKKLGGKNGWIPDAIVWKTSKYDDYVNGIDFVVETNDKEFALATDITFSHSKNLIHKLDRTKQFINRGKLPVLAFYERVEGTVNKPIPYVTIAVEHDKIVKALKIWADGQGDMLENHPLKAKTMLELEAQLESFAIYAKAVNKRNIASAYNDMLAKIQLLIVNHEDTIKKYRNLIDDDEAYKTIIKFCDELKKEAEQIEQAQKERRNS